ncbi:MAG TPA: helix-turn-helix transcriptional regulator, partial [Candidatus Pullilachnospira stercoravium]|nr:helix-turn-helix transcriptional regulator [Candidatus Pullilachnospira stercoravium]
VVNTLFTLKDVENYYLQFYLNIAHMLQPHSIYNTGELIDQIRTYMQKNYQKNITQDFLASLFFLNRSYLSQLFRRKTGQKFIDYLNEIRIEKAKEQLISTDRKMYQIARFVGYDNVKYFFRIFKKKTGISPEQFREQEKTENSGKKILETVE